MQINTIRGIEKGMRFFSGVKSFGYYALLATSFLTMFIFWIFILMYFEPFKNLSLFILRFIQLGFLMLVVGQVFYSFLDMIDLYLYNKEMKKYEIKTKEEVIDIQSQNARNKRREKRASKK